MVMLRAFPEPATRPNRSFQLSPELDQGSLKEEDLHFDLEGEAARLRTAAARPR
jgi:hypothetical protein